MDLNELEFRKLHGYESPTAKFDWKGYIPKIKCGYHWILNMFPILTWLPKYKKSYVLADILTGLTTGVMIIPQGMGYALIAEVHPVFGLYTAFFPALIYVIFGTSSHLSAGPFSLTSIILGSTIITAIPDPVPGDSNTTMFNISLAFIDVYEERIEYATLVTLLAGLLMIVFHILQLGFVTLLFARPMRSGFIFGAAITVCVSQLRWLFGVNVVSQKDPFASINTIINVIKALTQLEGGQISRTASSVITSFICIAFLATIKYINQKYSHKFPLKLKIPGEIFVLVVGIGVSYGANLEETYWLPTIGTVPSGLPAPVSPNISRFPDVIATAIVIAIVGYSVEVSLAETFASRGGYKIRPNQELLALGVMNAFSSFFQCIPSFTALSRSTVQFESGGKTLLVGVVASSLVLIVILFLGPVLSFLPTACLGSIVVVGISGLFKNARNIKRFWVARQKVDSFTFVCTAIATVILGVMYGLLFGVCFALLMVIFKSSYVRMTSLISVDDTNIYRRKRYYAENHFAKLPENVHVLKFPGILNYLNCTLFSRDLLVKIRKAKIKEDDIVLQNVQDTSIENNGTTMEVEKKYVILDCSAIHSIDTVATTSFLEVMKNTKLEGTDLLLASCPENILNTICKQDKKILKISFPTIPAAVSYVSQIKDDRNSTSVIT